MPFPQTGFLDQFNRPDEGPPPTGWTSETGSAKGHIVSSNALLPSDNTTQCASTWNTSFNADQEAYMDLTGMIPQDAAFSLVLRANGQAPMFDNNVFYSVRFTRITGASNDTVDFFSWSSGTPTAIGSATTLTSDLQNTDQLGARIVGNTLTAWKNGVQQATQTDHRGSCGRHARRRGRSRSRPSRGARGGR